MTTETDQKQPLVGNQPDARSKVARNAERAAWILASCALIYYFGIKEAFQSQGHRCLILI
jgi:hypothetical protein